MPLRSERGEVVVVFSGEDYSESGTTQGLKARGHELDAVDTNYLVHLGEEDPSFPAGLNGRFHGLLIDRNRRTSTLFNDRFGMHRIYYHESKDAFYFAAEAKAILTVCPELRRMSPQGLGEFVACGSVLGNRTLFDGVHLLPPASAWTFRNSSLERRHSYFQPSEWEDQEKLDPKSYYRELRQVFTRNLPRYLKSHQRVAMSLTGGLDTRMVMAWHRPQPGSLPCYTFGGMRRDCQDVVVAREVARLCEQPHQVIGLGEEFLSRFSHYAERTVYLTDGCVSVGLTPDLYLHERAREIAPVRLTGLYGGEILRGARALKPEEPPPGLFSPEFVPYIRQAKETYRDVVQGHPVSFAAFRQAPWYHCGILALEETQLSVRTPFLDNDLVRTVIRAPQSALGNNDVSLRLIADGNPALARIPTDRGVRGDQRGFGEAFSRAFLEFLFKAEYAYDMGMPQWLAQLDKACSPLSLERIFLGRHKIFHFRVWYRDALAGYVREMLLDPRSLSRSYIDRKGLEALVREHHKGNRNYTTEIHKLLTLEIANRLFLDNPERGGFGEHPGVPVAVSTDH
ncbi:asparagine synthase-related protein [Tunturibacter psychrotolerans]|uniref:asparagine synthase (glutamine-hydrolyzing) n=1 Tax=Tunturiibacter psychrotolerans TaxID=3069686 RepID=A0AAU7ZX56_9BACT